MKIFDNNEESDQRLCLDQVEWFHLLYGSLQHSSKDPPQQRTAEDFTNQTTPRKPLSPTASNPTKPWQTSEITRKSQHSS
jgi:hypothetical protein